MSPEKVSVFGISEAKIWTEHNNYIIMARNNGHAWQKVRSLINFLTETDELLSDICRLSKKCLFQSLQDLTIHKLYKYCRQFAQKDIIRSFFD